MLFYHFVFRLSILFCPNFIYINKTNQRDWCNPFDLLIIFFPYTFSIFAAGVIDPMQLLMHPTAPLRHQSWQNDCAVLSFSVLYTPGVSLSRKSPRNNQYPLERSFMAFSISRFAVFSAAASRLSYSFFPFANASSIFILSFLK